VSDLLGFWGIARREARTPGNVPIMHTLSPGLGWSFNEKDTLEDAHVIKKFQDSYRLPVRTSRETRDSR
jgi:hypothetical protein